jgi:hypothetical protein
MPSPWMRAMTPPWWGTMRSYNVRSPASMAA